MAVSFVSLGTEDILQRYRVTKIFATYVTVKELVFLYREFLGILKRPIM